MIRKILIIIFCFNIHLLQANELEKGMFALEMEDYDRALYYLSFEAAQGNPIAQYNLGLMYKNGVGVKKDLNEAIKMFSLIISIDSNWAEAWNKRATALYLYGRYDESISDIKKVLKIEPRHFGAIIGLSLNNIELK